MAERSSKLAVKTEAAPAPSGPGPWAPFDTLRREVNRLFEDFTPDFWRSPNVAVTTWPGLAEWVLTPAVDVAEQDGSFRITAELPGIAASDIQVKISDGRLSISGEKSHGEKEERADYYRSERQFGKFQRSFTLPDSVEVDKIKASFANGVLTVSLPKSEKAKASGKTIEVKAA